MPAPTSRRETVADAALALLAERGMRGLTHRAVDEAAELPPGATSNVARTRAALLELVVRRLAEREGGVLTEIGQEELGSGVEGLAGGLAAAVHSSLTGHRELLLARYELALEATRRPELRAVYDSAGRDLRTPLREALAAVGSRDPERHAFALVALADGIMFTGGAGAYAAAPPGRAEIAAVIGELLGGMLAE